MRRTETNAHLWHIRNSQKALKFKFKLRKKRKKRFHSIKYNCSMHIAGAKGQCLVTFSLKDFFFLNNKIKGSGIFSLFNRRDGDTWNDGLYKMGKGSPPTERP